MKIISADFVTSAAAGGTDLGIPIALAIGIQNIPEGFMGQTVVELNIGVGGLGLQGGDIVGECGHVAVDIETNFLRRERIDGVYENVEAFLGGQAADIDHPQAVGWFGMESPAVGRKLDAVWNNSYLVGLDTKLDISVPDEIGWSN